jgi:hypothetical protein
MARYCCIIGVTMDFPALLPADFVGTGAFFGLAFSDDPVKDIK